jgi:hypothetical protein
VHGRTLHHAGEAKGRMGVIDFYAVLLLVGEMGLELDLEICDVRTGLAQNLAGVGILEERKEQVLDRGELVAATAGTEDRNVHADS